MKDWQNNGVEPTSSDELQATERAQKRIFDNFCRALRELKDHPVQGHSLEGWHALEQMKKISMPIPKEFHDGSMVQLARCFKSAEAAIETSFPRVQKSLKEWGLYQPYQPPMLLLRGLYGYLVLYNRQVFLNLMAETNAVVFARSCDTVASHFESFLVCFLPRPEL